MTEIHFLLLKVVPQPDKIKVGRDENQCLGHDSVLVLRQNLTKKQLQFSKNMELIIYFYIIRNYWYYIYHACIYLFYYIMKLHIWVQLLKGLIAYPLDKDIITVCILTKCLKRWRIYLFYLQFNKVEGF